MKRTLRTRLIAALVLVCLLPATLASCKATERYQDAPVASHEDSAAAVLNFPDGFSNVATKCDGPNRVYVIFHGDRGYGALAVAPNDPRCTATN